MHDVLIFPGISDEGIDTVFYKKKSINKNDRCEN
jgi:hypothetical protein